MDVPFCWDVLGIPAGEIEPASGLRKIGLFGQLADVASAGGGCILFPSCRAEDVTRSNAAVTSAIMNSCRTANTLVLGQQLQMCPNPLSPSAPGRSRRSRS